MNEVVSESSEYIHGSSPEEQHRLFLLNGILNESCLRELNLQQGEKVLDLGSGLGQFTRLIAQTVGSSGHVVGIERDQNQILQANGLADRSGESELVVFRKGDALSRLVLGGQRLCGVIPLSHQIWRAGYGGKVTIAGDGFGKIGA
jgi:16S rRNA A1518/A1519 N6-dimethyltransferase RsmA/KsgA/DIM1 with predicted DNA glycosylase/AP lyase activity